MPLFDVTHGIPKLVKPENAESYEILGTAARVLLKLRFEKDQRIVDQALQKTVEVAQKNDKLVFMKTGILAGHKSLTPHADVIHLWASAEEVYPSRHLRIGSNDELQAQEMQKKFIGGMVRWRTSLRPETWLVYRRETDSRNKFTDKIIRVSEYWINEDFVYQELTHIKHTVDGLMEHINSRRHP